MTRLAVSLFLTLAFSGWSRAHACGDYVDRRPEAWIEREVAAYCRIRWPEERLTHIGVRPSGDSGTHLRVRVMFFRERNEYERVLMLHRHTDRWIVRRAGQAQSTGYRLDAYGFPVLTQRNENVTAQGQTRSPEGLPHSCRSGS